MENNQTMRKWSDLYKLNVTVPSEGITLGQVEDFFFKEESNSIYALCVRTHLYGDLSLPVTGILAVEKDRVTIRNANMLTKALPPLVRGQQLISRQVVNGKENVLGTIKDVVIAVEPPSVMHVQGFEMLHGSSTRSFGAAGVANFNNETNTIVVYDHTAKKLH